MTNRYFYKHAVTGIVALMDEDFASIFGDQLQRVDAPQADAPVSDTPRLGTRRKPTKIPTLPNPDSSKEGNK